MGTTGVKTRRDAELTIIEQAAGDQEFRNKLLADPQPAIEKAIGVKLPDGVRVTVLQETDRQLYLVLPAQSALQDGELTDSELSAVSGGLDRNAGKSQGLPGVEETALPSNFANAAQKVMPGM